jgi:hypothetical protein
MVEVLSACGTPTDKARRACPPIEPGIQHAARSYLLTTLQQDNLQPTKPRTLKTSTLVDFGLTFPSALCNRPALRYAPHLVNNGIHRYDIHRTRSSVHSERAHISPALSTHCNMCPNMCVRSFYIQSLVYICLLREPISVCCESL